MKTFFRESFVPVIMLLAIVLVALVILRRVAETHSRMPSVIKIAAAEVEWSADSARYGDPSGAQSLADFEGSPTGKGSSLVERAMEMAANDSLTEALVLVDILLERNPHYGGAWFGKGSILSRMGKLMAALEAYEKAASYTAGVDKAIPLYNAACLYREMGKDKEAIQRFHYAIDQRPDYLEARLNLAILVSRQEGMLDEAFRLYDQLVRLDPGYVSAYYNRGVLRMGNGLSDSALTDFRQTVALDSSFAKAWYNIGLLESRAKNHEEAIEAYMSAIEADSRYMKARLNLAVALARLDRHHEAIEVGEAIVEEDPSYARAWYNLGIAYSKLELYDRARESYSRVIKLEPLNARAWQNLGVVYARSGQGRKAIECYLEVLAIEPGHTGARYNLALEHRRMGNLEMALEEAARVCRLEPDNSKARSFLRTTANRILDKNPGDEKATRLLREFWGDLSAKSDG